MPFVTTNAAELWLLSNFDDLRLNGQNTDSAGNIYTIDALDDDATWGSPVPIDTAVQRWQTDGAVAATQGHENREISFKVRVEAASPAALAAGESALALRASKPCSLKWIPPTGSATTPASVFEVWTWHLEHDLDSGDERHLQRSYVVRMTAKPWVRSANQTTVTALTPPGVPTTTLIDACTSTTGWTGTPNAPTTSGGAVLESQTGGSGTRILTRTSLVSGMTTTPYLMLDMSVSGPIASYTFDVSTDGNGWFKVAQIGTVSYWKAVTPLNSFVALRIELSFSVTHGGPVVLSVADVSRTDTIGAVGTSRKQLSRHIDVGGSVPTSGSIQVASPSATQLGTCLVYTAPDDGSGFSPPLRPYRTSGNTVTADATCASGSHEAFVTAGASAGTITFTIPSQRLPAATYVVLARFQFGGLATMTVTTTASTALGTPTTLVTSVPSAGIILGWGVLGTMTLPTQALPPESTVNTVITISGTANTGTHFLDEVYLIDVTHGDMTLVGPTNTRLWVDAPDANSSNLPALYVGSAADRSDAVTPLSSRLISFGDHDLDPGGTTVFTVTDGVDNAAVSATFYQRWHTHAGA